MIESGVIQTFARHARHYDRYARLQQRVGGELLAGYRPACPPGRILEVGCGTGHFTGLLRERFPKAEIHAIDPCAPMVDQARRKPWAETIRWTIGRVDDVPPERRFDLAAANAALHWPDDRPALLAALRRRLDDGGRLLASCFGPRTYEELGVVLSRWAGRSLSLTARRFADRVTLEAELMCHWPSVSIREQRYRRDYGDLWTLLRSIKYTGTRGDGVVDLHLTRRDVAALEREFLHQWGRVAVTIQVFYVQAGGNP